MDKDCIRTELNRVAPMVEQAKRSHREMRMHMADQGLEEFERFSAQDQTGRLAEILAAQPEFAADRQRLLLTGNTWIPLAPDLLALHAGLIAAEDDPDKSIVWLEMIAALRSARIRLVNEVLGIVPPERDIKVANFQLLPFASLPSTRTSRLARRAYEWSPYVPFPIPPDVALVATVDVPVPLATVPDLAQDGEELRLATERVHAAINLLTGAGNAAPILMRGWSEFEDPDLERLQSGFSWAMPHEVAHPTTKLVLDEPALEFLDRCLALTGELKRRIVLACQHLSLARRRRNLGERATEVSICLESLLGDNARMDLTYKLTVRAGLIGAADLKERLSLSELVSELYKLRGQVVHGKLITVSEQQVELVDRACDLAGRILRRLVAHGRLPDWRTVELSGGSELARPS